MYIYVSIYTNCWFASNSQSISDDTNLLASCKSNIDMECAPTPDHLDRLIACERAAIDYR